MPNERLVGFAAFYRIHLSLGEDEPDTKTLAGQLGASRETVNKWRRQIEHRKTVFQQEPEFDDQSKFLGWKTIK